MEYYSSYGSEGLMEGIFALLAVYMIFFIGLIIVAVVANWKMFGKAGIPGWHSLIPFVSTWQSFKLAYGESKPLMFILTFIPVVNIVVLILRNYKIGYNFGKDSKQIFGILYVLFSFVVGLIIAFGKDNVYENPIDGSNKVR